MNEIATKSNDLNVLKHQMVNVINKLQTCHNLSEIMPLLKLLRALQHYISTVDHTEHQDPAANNEKNYKLGSEKVKLTQKLCFLFNRIRIEGAYVSSLNNSIAYGFKTYFTNKDINMFCQQKAISQSKKRVFITSLNLLLRENHLFNTCGIPLDKLTNLLMSDVESEMVEINKKIQDGCTVCGQNGEDLCLCKMKFVNIKENQCYTGSLKFKFHSFMGMYELSYLENILNNNAPRLNPDQFNCCSTNNKIKRRCGVTVKEKTKFSDWTTGQLSISGHFELINAKEIEIQVWEAVTSSKQETSEQIVALAVVSLQSMIELEDSKQINISMEPEGCTVGEIKFSPNNAKIDHDMNKENRPDSSINTGGVKRRMNIFTKLTGYRLARHVETNIPVSLWLDWFQNHIDRLAVPIESDSKIPPAHKKTKVFGLNNKKIVITPCKTPVLNNALHESYRQISNSPVPQILVVTPKLCQINPRSLVKSIQFADQEAVSNIPEEQISPKQFFMSTPIQNKSTKSDKLTPFFKVESNDQEAILSPIQTTNCKTPKRSTKYFNEQVSIVQESNIINILKTSNFMADTSFTRSNINLTDDFEDIKETSFSRKNRKSESVICSKYYLNESADASDFRQATMFSKNMLLSPFPLDSRIDYLPDRNSPSTSRNSDSRVSRKHDKSQISERSFNTENESSSIVLDSFKHGGIDHFDIDPSSDGGMDNGEHGVNAEEIVAEHEQNSEDDIDDKLNVLRMDDLDLLSVLGQGHFGKVLLAQVRETKQLCAIKSIQKVRACTETEYDSLTAERKILMLIRDSRHPFFVNLIGCFQTERYLFFAMEYVAGGDFMGHVHEKPFSENDAKFHLACIVMAFEFLHSNDIIYRDLKLDNVLMDHQGYARLTDFGLSKEGMKWNSSTNTFCGTPEFLAPEIIDQQNYTRVIDWWALGVLTYEMIIGESPFPGDEDEEIFQSILRSTPDCSGLSAEGVSFVRRLLKRTPEKRLGYGENGAENVKAHSFFKSIDWVKMYSKQVRPPFVPDLNHDADTKYFESEFTNQAVTFEHEDEDHDLNICDEMFRNFDSDQQWNNI